MKLGEVAFDKTSAERSQPEEIDSLYQHLREA